MTPDLIVVEPASVIDQSLGTVDEMFRASTDGEASRICVRVRRKVGSETLRLRPQPFEAKDD